MTDDHGLARSVAVYVITVIVVAVAIVVIIAITVFVIGLLASWVPLRALSKRFLQTGNAN